MESENNISIEIINAQDKKTPKVIFIVPYRDREQQLSFFQRHMKYILEDKKDHEIYYSHQCDKRDFNRGGMKNIGFLAIKKKYPEDYKNITLVFNDVDTMPYTKDFLNYETKKGIVKHFYGFEYTLGGIVSINAEDFENINGFPNFWAWGYEDNLFQIRVENIGIMIDRSNYYPIADKNILQCADGLVRTVNRGEYEAFKKETKDGINGIINLEYTIDEKNFINITNFDTVIKQDKSKDKQHDLRKGNNVFQGRPGNRMNMVLM